MRQCSPVTADTTFSLLDERFMVTDLLVEAGVADKLITPIETMAMWAASQVLSDGDSFHASEVAAVIDVPPGRAASWIRQLNICYELFETHIERNGRTWQRRYTLTELGEQVLGVFTSAEQ